MKTEEELKDTFVELEKLKSKVGMEFGKYSVSFSADDVDSFVDSALEALVVLSKMQLLTEILDGDSEKVKALKQEIEENYIKPLSKMVKDQLNK